MDGLKDDQLELLQVLRTKDEGLTRSLLNSKERSLGWKEDQITLSMLKISQREFFLDTPLSKRATSASTKATVIQFPIKVTHAINAHKIQGQTLSNPFTLDIKSIFDDAQNVKESTGRTGWNE